MAAKAKKSFKPTALMKAFVREYLLCRNGVEAMKKAGYTSKNPDVDASKLTQHPWVAEQIAAAEAAAQAKFEIKQEEIISELHNLAFANIGDVLDWSKDGEVTLKAKDQMSARGLAFIDSIKIERGTVKTKDAEGNEDVETYVKDLKVTTIAKEKRKALRDLGEHIGMWREPKYGGDDPTRPESEGEARKSSLERLSAILRKSKL